MIARNSTMQEGKDQSNGETIFEDPEADLEENWTDEDKKIGFRRRDYQIEISEWVIQALTTPGRGKANVAADRGYGKTWLGVWVAYQMHVRYGFKVLLIAPPGEVTSTWTRLLDRAGVPYFTPLSGQKLAGTRGKQIGVNAGQPVFAEAKLSHKWLVRGNDDIGPFHASVEYQEALRGDGVLLIADEFAFAKNKTAARHWALVELVQFADADPQAKFAGLFLSALFAAEGKNYESLFRVLNITGGHKEMMVINKKTQVNQWVEHGLGAVVEEAKRIDLITTEHLLDECALVRPGPPGTRLDYKYRFVTKTMHEFLRQLWEKVLCKEYQPYTEDVKYSNHEGVEFKFVKYNAFCQLPPDEAAECDGAIQSLKRANIIRDDGRVDVQAAKRSIAQVQSALMRLIHAKTPELMRRAKDRLKADQFKKLILIVPFLEDQEYLMNNLKLYGAVQVNGKIKFEDRSRNIALFNEANIKCRVIIITPEAGGIGVSLHDHVEPNDEEFKPYAHMFKSKKDLIFPRELLALSNFNYLAMFQAYGRAYRSGMRSDVILSVIYAANASVESVLINTMMKSKVAKGMNLAKQREYPDQFEVYVDPKYPDASTLRDFLNRMRNLTLEEMKK